MSLGGIVVSRSLRVGGYELDEAIAGHIRREHHLAARLQTAEDVKLEIGSAWALDTSWRRRSEAATSSTDCRRRSS